MQAPRLGQGGVAAPTTDIAKRPQLAQTGRLFKKIESILVQPPRLRGSRKLRRYFLIAQPPLLIRACCPAISGDHNFRTNGFVAQLKSRMPDSATSAMGRG